MNIFKSQAKNEFGVDFIGSEKMEIEQNKWFDIIKGCPWWVRESEDNGGNLKSINFAKFLCYYTSKKTCLDLKITISGSERADYINDVIDTMVRKSLRDKVEDACAYGGIMIKPNGTYNQNGALDYILPGWFVVTDCNSNGDILGAIFISRKQRGDKWYTRLEYQHFTSEAIDDVEGNVYIIEQKAFVSGNIDSLGREVSLTDVPEWAHVQPEIRISNVDKPLFAYFKLPSNNTIDYSSPEGVSIFVNAIEELKDLDVAWSRKSDEVYDSQHMTFIDDNALTRPASKDHPRGEKIQLPRFVKGVRGGVDPTTTVNEHVPTMLTTDRIADINSTLSMISTKAGFSQGQFVLDRKTGQITATEIESDDHETVETITDVRNALKQAVKDLVYAIDKYCDVFFDMPSGVVNILDPDTADEDVFYFKDLLASFEQDRTRAYQLMINGVYSKKHYLIEYEGFNEKEAIAMMQEAQDEKNTETESQQGLFANTAGSSQKSNEEE